MMTYVTIIHDQPKILHKPLIKTNLKKISLSYEGRIDIKNNLLSDLKRMLIIF